MTSASTTTRTTQRGVATIEFALVFSLLFFLFWGIVSYAFPLLILQTMNRAAAEAVRVSATVSPLLTNFETNIIQAAQNEANSQLAWLPPRWRQHIEVQVNVTTSAQCPLSFPRCQLNVSVRYDNYAGRPVVPALSFPGIGTMPRLPVNLRATSTLLTQ